MAASALSACGGGSSVSDTFRLEPPGGISCPALAINGPALISPAPGSTGVATTLSVLTFARIASIPQTISGNATLTGSDNTMLTARSQHHPTARRRPHRSQASSRTRPTR
jgi:hypothetical protein